MDKMKVHNLNVIYNKNKILKDINLDFEVGNIYGIIGANGSGKSTLLNALTQLINYTGDIKIGDIDIKNMNSKTRARKISYMRQNITPRFNLNVEEYISASRYPYNDKENLISSKSSMIKYMEICELNGFKDKNILNLSGGELQRVNYCKVLSQGADIILIDEGFSNLDIYFQIKFKKYLKDVIRKDNKIIIMVIHDINFALNYFDELIVIKNGMLYDKGSTVKVITSEMIRDVFNVESNIVENYIDFSFEEGE